MMSATVPPNTISSWNTVFSPVRKSSACLLAHESCLRKGQKINILYTVEINWHASHARHVSMWFGKSSCVLR